MKKRCVVLVVLAGLLTFTFQPLVLASSTPSPILWVAAGGNRYAGAYLDRTIRIWDASTQQLLYTIIDPTEIDFRYELIYQIHDLAFNPDGSLLAASFGGSGGSIRIFDAATGAMVSELRALSDSGDIAWKPDGTQLADRASSGGPWSNFFGHLMVWDMPAGNLVVDQDWGPSTGSSNISWSPDGSRLATVDDMLDGPTLFLSDTATLTRWPSTTFPVVITDITWSPDGSQIAGVDTRGTVYIVGVSSGQIVRTLPGISTRDYPQRLAWNVNNQIAVTSTNEVLIWDAATGRLLFTFQASSEDVAWLPGNRVLYTSSDSLSEPSILTLSTLTPTGENIPTDTGS